MSQVNTHKSCLVCGSFLLRELSEYLDGKMCSCMNCGFVFAKPIPTEQELIAHYEGYDRNDYLSPITVKRYHEILDMLEPFRKTNKLIDVGCGIGLFAEVAVERGWEVYGTEFTEEAISICKEKGIVMNQGVLDVNNYELGQFDVVTSFEVIEHVNNPVEEIQSFKKLLRPNGALYLTTPNFNSISRFLNGPKWSVICYPEHLCYYTPKTIHKLLANQKFGKKWITTTGVSITRFKKAAHGIETKYIDKDTDDEKLRGKMETIWYWKFIKVFVNGCLSFFGIGDAMKLLYIKK